jgi:hypothetical protein
MACCVELTFHSTCSVEPGQPTIAPGARPGMRVHGNTLLTNYSSEQAWLSNPPRANISLARPVADVFGTRSSTETSLR